MRWWELSTKDGVYYAPLSPGVQIWLDGELVATAPQQYETAGDYNVTLLDGQIVGRTNWLRSVVAITAQGLSSF